MDWCGGGVPSDNELDELIASAIAGGSTCGVYLDGVEDGRHQSSRALPVSDGPKFNFRLEAQYARTQSRL